MKKLYYIVVFILLIALIGSSLPVSAYNQGEEDAHALITGQAITILRNDGYREIADAVERNRGAIIAGIRDADDQFGRMTLEIVGLDVGNWNTAGNTHYYNPKAHPAQSGLKIDLLHTPDIAIHASYLLGLIRIRTDRVRGDGDSSRVFALRGPQPSAYRLADWYYALAVKAMREGRTYDAYFNLGKTIHMVQDLTVPQHATDSYGLPHHRHQDFENYADGYMLRADYLATTRPHYFPDLPISVYAEAAAVNSAEKISKVTWWHGNDFDGVGREMLHLSQKLTAGILHKFHQNWQTEPYSAIKVTVHVARALDQPDSLGPIADFAASVVDVVGDFLGDIPLLGDLVEGALDLVRNLLGRADLFVSLNVLEPGEPATGEDSYSYHFHTDDFATGYFADKDVVFPGDYLGYNVWTFPYTSETVRAGEEVKMILGLWDDDDTDGWITSVSGWPRAFFRPHWIDINPDNGYRLYLKANLRTGDVSRWTGRDWLVIDQLGERIILSGGQSDRTVVYGGRGEIEFSVDGIYLPVREPVPQRPQMPVNRLPAPGQRGVSLTPTLMASSYVDLDLDPQFDSEWVISEMPGDVVYEARGGARNSHTITRPLKWGKTYGWMVRYQDSTRRWSEWSTPTFFSTSNPPATPTNELPANEATGVPVRPLLSASAYSDPEGNPHIASEWEVDVLTRVLGRPNFLNVCRLVTEGRVTARGTIEGTTSHTLRDDLSLNARYFWRVRYQDALGAWSEWSERTPFTTTAIALAPMPPVVIPPPPPPPPPPPVIPPPVTIMPALEVTLPNGGETLLAGSEYGIHWRTIGTGMVSVDIDYTTDGGVSWLSIARGVPNIGVYAWRVPATPSNTCLVKITGRDQDGRILATDQSDRHFAIAVVMPPVVIPPPPPPPPPVPPVTPPPVTIMPALEVTLPNGGETLLTGSEYGIQWGTIGTGLVSVDIDYTTDGGVSWLSIARGVPNVGTYAWRVPGTPSNTCLVKITGRDRDGRILATDQSDRHFAIAAATKGR